MKSEQIESINLAGFVPEMVKIESSSVIWKRFIFSLLISCLGRELLS